MNCEPRGATATRRESLSADGRIELVGALAPRYPVHVVYVASARKAHREFTRWCQRRNMTARVIGEGARLHSDPADTDVRHGHGRYRADGGETAHPTYPVAYSVSGPGDYAELRAITYTRPNGSAAPIVERMHLETVLTPLGPGTGQGELSEGAARRMRRDAIEGRYRAGERARGGIRAHADAPHAPESTAGVDLAFIAELESLLSADAELRGGRVTRAKEVYGEPGRYWVRVEFPHRAPIRKLLSLPTAPARITSRPADERRAAELSRLSPPATTDENARSFGLARAE